MARLNTASPRNTSDHYQSNLKCAIRSRLKNERLKRQIREVDADKKSTAPHRSALEEQFAQTIAENDTLFETLRHQIKRLLLKLSDSRQARIIPDPFKSSRLVQFDEAQHRRRSIFKQLTGWLKKCWRVAPRFEKRLYLSMIKLAMIGWNLQKIATANSQV